jgi:HSP20 family molecular chaperone IbpA
MSNNLKVWKDLADTFLSGFNTDFDEMYNYYKSKFNNMQSCNNKDKECGCAGGLCTCDFNDNFLIDNGENYKLTMDVNPKATAKDITIDLEDNQLKIEYTFKDGNCKTSSSIIETLPNDADEGEITATVENGKLVVVVGKIPQEIDIDVETDNKNIKINRK